MKKSLMTKLAVLAAVIGASSSAFAELPAELTAGYASITADFSDLLAEHWPLLTTVTIAFLIMRLYKRTVKTV